MINELILYEVQINSYIEGIAGLYIYNSALLQYNIIALPK